MAAGDGASNAWEVAIRFDDPRELDIAIGADADLLDALPFARTSFQQHDDQGFLLSRKVALLLERLG